ncbi:hypothetical protein DPMN_130405 [Dreissena polymorpha]|uniref:Prohibitin n=1 Tax=Dreissena polymorpha TaxID=45954 RepID=A0A9D4H4I9_DREPO|nr:hypothetical protein DPMN_130405 [Dreissena polymorpha]
MRQQVSLMIRNDLVERARDFHIVLDDVSITDLTFSKEYSTAVESKQVSTGLELGANLKHGLKLSKISWNSFQMGYCLLFSFFIL